MKYSVFLRFKNRENLLKFLNSISPSLGFISKISPELITFMVSAFWHGFYPNYYIFFFTCYIVEQICSILQSNTYYFEFLDNLYKQSLLHKAMYFFIGMIHLNFLNFCGLFFQMLTFDKLWMITKNTTGFYLIGLLLAFIVVNVIPRSKEKSSVPKSNSTVSNSNGVEQVSK